MQRIQHSDVLVMRRKGPVGLLCVGNEVEVQVVGLGAELHDEGAVAGYGGVTGRSLHRGWVDGTASEE